MDDNTHQYLMPIIQVAVRRSAHKWRRHLEPSELFSIGWLWAYDHPSKVNAAVTDDDQKRAVKRLTIALCKALDSAGRREKAHREGYAPEDEAFYTPAMVETILPSVYDRTRKPPSSEDESSSKGRVAGPGMGWETTVVDVERGLAAADLSDDQSYMLELRHRVGATHAQIAGVMGVSESTVRNRLRDATQQVARALGGPTPHCGRGCECVGSRHVMSNATARAVTSHQYDPD